ncbi:MAG: hypothetical protein KF870_06030 [Leadbetterella sp.]|nr:hypothetical protein [Leadbetterella sp.]
MKNLYRENLISLVRSLENILDELEITIINLAMSGEFSDFNDQCEIGEVMRIRIEDFKNADDQNIKTCIELFNSIEQSYIYIMNINAIKRKEIEGDNPNEH